MYRIIFGQGLLKRQRPWLTGKEIVQFLYLATESLAIYKSSAYYFGVARVLFDLGWIAIYQEDIPPAKSLAGKSLHLCHLLGERESWSNVWKSLQLLQRKREMPKVGLYYSEADQALWETMHVRRSIAQHSAATQAQAEALIDKKLPETVFLSLWQQGG